MNDVWGGLGTAVYGIVGHPLTHTLSPRMQNAAFRALDLSAVYLPWPLAPDGFRPGVARLVEAGVRGLNVTAPFKVEAAGLVDDLDRAARRSGSVNTIRVEGDRLRGTSTDGVGFRRDLEEADVPVRGRRVVVLGAGGAARAVALDLLEGGAAWVSVFARRPERVGWVPVGLGEVRDLDELAAGDGSVLREADLLVQATPVGQEGTDALPVPWMAVRPSTMVVEMIYEPLLTPFLKQAEARGCRVRNGLGMLLHQGAAAFEFWTGREAPVEAMRDALSRA